MYELLSKITGLLGIAKKHAPSPTTGNDEASGLSKAKAPVPVPVPAGKPIDGAGSAPADPKPALNPDQRPVLKGVAVQQAGSVPAVRAPSQTASRFQVLTQVQIDALLSSPLEILSGEDVGLTHTQSKYLVLVRNTQTSVQLLVIAKGYELDKHTSSARVQLQRGKLSWKYEVIVDLPVIRQLYTKGGVDPDAESGIMFDVAQRGKEFMSLIEKAASCRSTDMHLIVTEHEAKAERRVYGDLEPFEHMISAQALEICHAAYAMADNPSSTMYNSMEDQDARITRHSAKKVKLSLPDGVQSLRLQYTPLPPGGRYLVVRLLYDQKVAPDQGVDSLGFAKHQLDDIEMMSSRPYGVMVVSGPTGSGKSTTIQLVVTVSKRENPGRNFITIEDPPEYLIENVKQLALHIDRAGTTKAQAYQAKMSTVLRLDPDTIVVGEVREKLAADLLFQAAMSGHNVLTTLHANTAPDCLDRFKDIGVEKYKLNDVGYIAGFIAQRLFSKINGEYGLTIEEAEAAKLLSPIRMRALKLAVGPYADKVRFAAPPKLVPPKIMRAGFRIVTETLVPDQEFLELYNGGNKSKAIAHWKENLGGTTMDENALALVCSGTVCPKEYVKHIGQFKPISDDRRDLVIQKFAA